jgi:hypothetical protein
LGERADWNHIQCNNLVNGIVNDNAVEDDMFDITAQMQLETIHFDRIKRASRC